MIEQIEDLSLSELAELRSAWIEKWGEPDEPRRRRRTHRSPGGDAITNDAPDEDDGKAGGAGVREPRPVIPPAGSTGAAADPKEDADLPAEVGRSRP